MGTVSGRPAISCALPPSRDLPAYAQVAEELGYERLWVYDSPALYGDIWLALGRAAEATTRIKLATGVAVPSLRHVMVTAAAIAAVDELAPGRLAAAFGTGFSARRAMGRAPMRWADLAEYVTALRGLLAGEVVMVDGAACQMIHSPGFGSPRPLKVPLLVAPIGPKGFAVAHQVADGVVLVSEPTEPLSEQWRTCALLVNGTVLEPGEDHTSERILDTIGPTHASGYHALWEWDRAAVDGLPGGAEWRAGIESERPPDQQHLAVHEGHWVAVTERDRPAIAAAGADVLTVGWTGDAGLVRDRFEHAGSTGVTEVVFTASGAHIERELAAFAAAVRSGD